MSNQRSYRCRQNDHDVDKICRLRRFPPFSNCLQTEEEEVEEHVGINHVVEDLGHNIVTLVTSPNQKAQHGELVQL